MNSHAVYPFLDFGDSFCSHVTVTMPFLGKMQFTMIDNYNPA